MPSHTPSLSRIGNTYITFAKQFYNSEPYDLTPLLDYLPDLKLDNKYVLEDFRPREQTNSVLWLYVRDRKNERLYDDTDNRKNPFYVFGQNWNKCYASKLIKIAGIPIFKYKKRLKPIKPFLHITLPFTEEAVWQAYLLQRTYHIIGMRWHGGYAARFFLNQPDDIDKIGEIYNIANYESRTVIEELIEACRKAFSPPTVKLMDNMAIITHCWFDDWNGLIRVTWQGKYNKKKMRMGNFEIATEETLVEYNCRIKY